MATTKTVTLSEPIALGSQTITELTLTSSARALRGFSMAVKDDGAMSFEPFALAAVGVRMSGLPEDQVLDRLSLPDVMELSNVVLDFLLSGRAAGSAPSASSPPPSQA